MSLVVRSLLGTWRAGTDDFRLRELEGLVLIR